MFADWETYRKIKILNKIFESYQHRLLNEWNPTEAHRSIVSITDDTDAVNI